MHSLDYKPIATFDTSALNRLMKSEAELASTVSLIRGKRHVRLTGLSIDEIASTPNPALRRTLLTCCNMLICDSEDGDCLLPQNALITALVAQHFKSPSTFDWTKAEVLTWAYHQEICGHTHILDDELAAEQRQQQHELQKQYKQAFTSVRNRIDEAYAVTGNARPLTFQEMLAELEAVSPTILVRHCEGLYRKALKGVDIDSRLAAELVSKCPPIRALIYSSLMSTYDIAARHKHLGERFRAGRNDLYMSIYLPYCDEFVTDEKGAEQARCLREIATVADITTEVLSYDDFLKGLDFRKHETVRRF